MDEDDPYPDDLARLAAEADDVARRMARAQDPHARFDGSDADGVVTVVVDGGGQVHDVKLLRSWRQRVGGGGLPSAVRAAVEAALLARLEGLDRALGKALDEPDGPAAPAPPTLDADVQRLAESISAHADTETAIGALREVLCLLETLDSSLDELSTQLEAGANRTYTGRSTGWHASVTVTAVGAVTSVDLDERWLATAHEHTIGREIREAIQQAQQVAGRHSVQGLIADSPAGRIGRLATDPVELTRRLGLHTDR